VTGGTFLALRLGALVALFAVGVTLRRMRVLEPRHAAWLLKLVVNLGLPALIFATVSRMPLRAEHVWLPAIAILAMLSALPVAMLAGRAFALPRTTLGAFIVCTMAMNVALEYPFVMLGWGPTAFSELALFDLGNSLISFTVVYFVAALHGSDPAHRWQAFGRFLSFPPLWALAAALVVNKLQLPLPLPITDGLQVVGQVIVLGVIVALGVYFDVRRVRSLPILAAAGLRFGVGLAVATLCVTVLGLAEPTRSIVVLGATAPIGFNALVLAHREALDTEFTASAASLSVLFGLFYVPAFLLFAG
jgi:predicted permease